MLVDCSMVLLVLLHFELVNDGDLLWLHSLDASSPGVCKRFGILRLRGHADEGMVLDGRVREDDRLGNVAADVWNTTTTIIQSGKAPF